MQQNHNTRNLIVGLLAGSAIGATLAFLYAPEKGAKMRARIRRKSDALLTEAKDKIDGAVESSSDTLREVRAKGERVLDGTAKTFEKITNKAADRLR